MKKGIKQLVLACSLVALTACGHTEKKTANDAEQPMVTIAISNEGHAELLDATSYEAAMALYGAVYEPLVEYGEKGVFQPGLATAWEIADEGKQYTFHLKEGVKFSDGSDLTAEAVKFTIERAQALNENSSLQTLVNLKEITIVDDTTVQLTFNQTSNQVLNELCQTRPLRIMSPNAVVDQKVTGEFKEPIGTGAFMVEKSTAEAATMLPNPYYNEEQPVAYQVTFQTIEDGSARTMALKSGEIDIAGGTLGAITDVDVAEMAKDADYTVHEFEGTMSHFLAFNPDNETLTQPVRRAIDLALDKQNLSEQPLVGLFRENVQYVTTENQVAVPQDLAASAKLLTDAGYVKNDKEFYANAQGELSVDLVIQTAEFPEWKEKAEIIESELKTAGIKLAIQVLDRESYYDVLWNTKEYDLIFYRTYTDALLPAYFLKSIYQNGADAHGLLANDATLSEQIQQFETLIDEAEQQAKFDEIFARFTAQSLAVPIEYKDEIFVTSSRIKTFNYSGLSDAPLDFQTLEVE